MHAQGDWTLVANLALEESSLHIPAVEPFKFPRRILARAETGEHYDEKVCPPKRDDEEVYPASDDEHVCPSFSSRENVLNSGH